LFAGELVTLRLERDPERQQLGAVGGEAPREGLVRHLLIALDVLLHVACGQRSPLGHEEGHQRELADQLVGVVRQGAPTLSSRYAATFERDSRCWCEGQYSRSGSGVRWHGLPLRVVARQRATPPSSAPASICSSMNVTAAATPSRTAHATSACAVIGKYRRMSWNSARSGLAK